MDAAAITALSLFLARSAASPPPVQTIQRRQLSKLLLAADAEFDTLCCRLSARRDWLDAHRCDDPPHTGYAKRRARFFAVDCKAHADAGELLDRAYALLATGERKAAA